MIEGDSTLYETVLPKRFKKWRCIWCYESILAAEKHYHYAGYWEGEKQNWRMHAECAAAFHDDDCGDGSIDAGACKRGTNELK